MVDIFMGRNIRKFCHFFGRLRNFLPVKSFVRDSLYPQNLTLTLTGNPQLFFQNDEKLHENKEIMVKTPLFAKVCTHKILEKGHLRKFLTRKSLPLV